MIRIFLTGDMGAGKTTLGKAFAREMTVPFIDLDWYIEERFHKSIRELFTERGEASFRELERNMLHEVGEFEDVVVSTGGGTPCFFDNMEYMNGCGQTVFLDVHPDILFRRLRVAKQQRPILQGKTDEESLLDAIREGAVLRVRPKAMTVAVILAGLFPIMWGTGTGSEVMQRIAAPMVGGMITAPLLSMFVVPVDYLLMRRPKLPKITLTIAKGL